MSQVLSDSERDSCELDADNLLKRYEAAGFWRGLLVQYQLEWAIVVAHLSYLCFYYRSWKAGEVDLYTSSVAQWQ